MNSADTDDASSSCSSSNADETKPKSSTRRYYSRSGDSDDADYFDFDLRHAVEQCRLDYKKTTVATPPFNEFERQIFSSRNRLSGQATISPFMFQVWKKRLIYPSF